MAQRKKKVNPLTEKIEGLRAYVAEKRAAARNPKDMDFLDGVVAVLAELDERVQCLEREIGHSGAFIDPTTAPDLPNKII